MRDDEAVVQRIAGVVENWIDPFQSDEQLCHFASGLVATEEVKTNLLLNAHDKGLEALRSFADQRLGRMEDGTKDFYSTLPLQLKTFSSMRKNKRCSEATQACFDIILSSYRPNNKKNHETYDGTGVQQTLNLTAFWKLAPGL